VRGLGLERERGLGLERRKCPVNATAKVYLPTLATAAAAPTVGESDTAIFENGAASGSVAGVTFDRVEGVSPQTFVVFSVGLGTYRFVWNAQ